MPTSDTRSPATPLPWKTLANSGERGLFCNRTLNMRSISAIGYDMDYTLIHYRVEEWERRAYEHMQRAARRARAGRSGDLEFDPDARDPRAGHRHRAGQPRQGQPLRLREARRRTAPRSLDFEEQREAYARTIVDSSEPRWVFLNTLFSLSEGCIYAQLVDLLDARQAAGRASGYADLYARVRASARRRAHGGRAQGGDHRRARRAS